MGGIVLAPFAAMKSGKTGFMIFWLLCFTSATSRAQIAMDGPLFVTPKKNFNASVKKTQSNKSDFLSDSVKLISKNKGTSSLIMGGVNGGGGDTTTSSVDQVNFELGGIQRNLKVYAHRVRFLRNVYVKNQPPVFDLKNINSMTEMEILSHPLFSQKVDQMTVNIQDEDCKDLFNESHVGSADVNKTSICLSRLRLLKVPFASLSTESLALAVHEVVHLLGGNEKKAQEVQKWVVGHASVSTRIMDGQTIRTFLSENLIGVMTEAGQFLKKVGTSRFPAICQSLAKVQFASDALQASIRNEFVLSILGQSWESSPMITDLILMSATCEYKEELASSDRIEWLKKALQWLEDLRGFSKALVDFDSPFRRLEAYSYYPITAVEEVAASPVLLNLLYSVENSTSNAIDKPICKLFDLKHEKQIELTEVNMSFKANLFTDDGLTVSMDFGFQNRGRWYMGSFQAGEQSVNNSFKYRLTKETENTKNTNYLGNIWGPVGVISLHMPKSMTMEFYVSRNVVENEHTVLQLYRLECELKKP